MTTKTRSSERVFFWNYSNRHGTQVILQFLEQIPLEDHFEDVLSKAMHGLGLSVEELAKRVELPAQAVDSLLEGDYAPEAARLVSSQLMLNQGRLHELATNPKRPICKLPDCIQLHNAPFPVPGYNGMTVNSYSVRVGDGRNTGLLFDAGSCFESLFETDNESKLSDWHLFLTHTDPDHVARVNKLTGVIANFYTPVDEPYGAASPVRAGDAYSFGALRLTALQTTGHSKGGTSYFLEGADLPVVFVGDALFRYSIGKVRAGYESALGQIRANLLSLPGETILCPGHGPITTVEFERTHNPFFA